MIDLFSVPAGTVPQVDPEHGVDHSSSFPVEIDDYLGKWVAVRRDEIIAVRDTEEDLLEALGEDQFGVHPVFLQAGRPPWGNEPGFHQNTVHEEYTQPGTGQSLRV
jgi:hypothetical protein